MPKGYNGKILRVDLTTEETGYQHLDEDTARKYIGGAGLAAKILWGETTSDTEPLSPENLLIFMTGPLTGSIVPSSSRYTVDGISPLSGIWGQAHGGANWAWELKHSGFDGIVVKGQSKRPVYLWLRDGKAEIRDAGHLWGRDTYEVPELLKDETDANASTACIGPAGEKLVRIACIMNDGKRGRAVARGGLGALMGSKKLKAITVRGTLPVDIYSQENLQNSVKRVYASFPPRKKEVVLEEGINILKSIFPIGGYPVKNWLEGTFEGGKKFVEDAQKASVIFCKGCPHGCGESLYTVDGERHTVYEAWGPLGTNCLIDNPEALQQAYSLCNRYGLDSISAGGVIAFAMECFEKGLLTKKDTDGIEFTWGNDEVLVEVVRKIGEKEGIGELLGDGVRRAAERIGGIASEYAMHVKGLEFPAHDPRASMSQALAYATCSFGAGHMEAGLGRSVENYSGSAIPTSYPDLGYPEALDRFAMEGKGELTAKTQNFHSMVDSLVVCMFLSWRLQPSNLVEMLNSATGWNLDLDEFMLTGERIFNLRRMFNVRRGISRKDDTLPSRFLTHKRGTGGAADSLPFLGLMLNEYYAYRGWSEEGIPTREKLTELGLEECFQGEGINEAG
jgi:aldehyde:ferredoxin oxidoreductase